MRTFSETLGQQGWPGGVVPATDPATSASLSSPRGRNSALALSTAGTPYVQKRMGLRTINTTALGGAVLGTFDYYRIADATHRQLVVTDDGVWSTINTATGATATIVSGLTSGTHYPDFAVANDMCFMVNGSNRRKYDGTTQTQFGIDRPTVGSLAGAAGAAGTPNATYELRVTYVNSSIGTESSASDTATATIALANQKLNLSNIPVSGDAQVDFVYIYVRNIATQLNFYKVGSVAAGVTTATGLNWTDSSLTTVAPGTDTNNRPPTTSKYLALHQGRMFVATDTALYYSGLNTPEAFAATAIEYVNRSDGQRITGLASDHEILLIFKEHSVYGLFNGNDPATWEIRLISGDFGCSSHRTIRSAYAWTFWWSQHGLVRWNGGGEVDPVGLRLYGDPSDRVEYSAIATTCAVRDEVHDRYIVALPGTGQTRATFLLPFNVSLGVFESDGWDPMDVSALGEGVDSTGTKRPYLGSYAGQVFRLWDTNADGIASSTTSEGTFTASATSMTVFTDSGATFDTTGAALIERKVTIIDSAGTFITTSGSRPRISANTGTTFTLSSAVTGLIIGRVYTYIIGGPDFQWDTPWRDYAEPWLKKRWEFVFILIKGVNFGSAAAIDVTFDWNDSTNSTKQRTYTSNSASGTWDDVTTLWDAAVWDSPTNIEQRFRVGRVGRSIRLRVRNGHTNQPFAVLMLGSQAVGETVKN